MMKSFKSYEKYLNSKGYFISDGLCYDVVNGILEFVTFDNKEKELSLQLRTVPNKKYAAKLATLQDGDEVDINPYDYDVNGAYIPCPICNIAGFISNDKDGISLVDVADGYNPHFMKDFKKCVWIQNHVMEQEDFILKSHLKNIQRIKHEFLPILKKFDFYQYYSSILDCKDDPDFTKNSSNPLIVFKHKTASSNYNMISFETDCINGRLKIQNQYFYFINNSEDFENYLITNIMTNKYGQIEIDYKYLFDSEYKPNTWMEILKCYQLIDGVEKGYFGTEVVEERLKDIDLTAIPVEDYEWLLGKIEKKLKNFMENKDLNLCEILKDCPKGTELYSPIFGKVEFDYLDYANDLICVLYTNNDYEAKSAYFQMDGTYITSEYGEIMLFPSKDNRDWSTWKNPKQKAERFDPKTLKTYDKVLVRDYFDTVWIASFFSSQRTKTEFGCVNGTWKYCIPYNDDTKHLVGTTDDAPEYYRYWED